MVAVSVTVFCVPSGWSSVTVIVSPGAGTPVKTAVICGGEPVGPATVASLRFDVTESSLKPNGGTGHILRERYRPGHRGRSQAAQAAGAEIGLTRARR